MNKRIYAGNGAEILVSLRDYYWLNIYRWQITSNGYAVAKIDGKRVLMHRLIMSPRPGYEVDHINGNKLDNRRENLREATHTQNMYNRRPNQQSSSPYKGVSRHNPSGRWVVHIRMDGKPVHIGLFDDPEEGARAYDRAARQLHGEFARLNFPEEVKLLDLSKSEWDTEIASLLADLPDDSADMQEAA